MTCRICGKPFDRIHYLSPYEEVCSNECFRKAYWLEIIGEKEEHVVINGKCYCIGSGKGYDKGCGGRSFTIRMLETGEIIETDDLWVNGDVPEAFRNELPDNAEFVER